jgi:hypothetical protein
MQRNFLMIDVKAILNALIQIITKFAHTLLFHNKIMKIIL